jgi:hypothetical protein
MITFYLYLFHNFGSFNKIFISSKAGSQKKSKSTFNNFCSYTLGF